MFPNYIELYYKEHSVICSTEPLTPSPVEISENSLLGRLDGEIKSIDSKDLSFILTPDYVVNSLKDNNDPLILKSVDELGKLIFLNRRKQNTVLKVLLFNLVLSNNERLITPRAKSVNIKAQQQPIQ